MSCKEAEDVYREELKSPSKIAPSLRVLEFFSGIGGWAEAFFQMGSIENIGELTVVEAIDINHISNEVYRHNFNKSPMCKSIETLTVDIIDSYRADMWVMSPPCQPFTRSNQTVVRDANDPRSNAFQYILKFLKESTAPPRYISLENVVGFEKSNCHHALIETLKSRNYSYVQFILSPYQFNIPNERPRYYLLGVLDGSFAKIDSGVIQESLPPSDSKISTELKLDFQRQSLKDFIDPPEQRNEVFLIPFITLEKTSSWCFDIVTEDDTSTSCFTRSYSRYAKGTGSVLLIPPEGDSASIYEDDHDVKKPRTQPQSHTQSPEVKLSLCDDFSKKSEYHRVYDELESQEPTVVEGDKRNESPSPTSHAIIPRSDPETRQFDENWKHKLLRRGYRLRYFSPTELLRLFGFNTNRFSFPVTLSHRKAFELIGNSINVTVVKHLLLFLFRESRLNSIE